MNTAIDSNQGTCTRALTPYNAAQLAAVPALLLAAGRGERMRPLTDTTPKPLLVVQGKPLLAWHLEALLRGGISRVVINTAWLGEQISDRFGHRFVLPPQHTEAPEAIADAQLQIAWSHEGQDFGHALETAGGVCRALELLCPAAGGDIFWVLAGDVFTPGFEFSRDAVTRFAASGKLAHLWLVPNPTHHPDGDFGFDASTGLASDQVPADPRPRYTYSTIGLYHRALFAPPWCDIASGNPHGIKAALAPLLRLAMRHGLVSATLYDGPWTDVGTAQRLAQLNAPGNAF